MENWVINDWFCNLEEGRQKVLLEDKWTLANAFGEHIFNENQTKMLQVKSVLEKLQKHNILTDHDNEMIRQLLEDL
ncbi:hypothetical protein NVP1193O_157 [Vibrio phage 1.193.O._10N.286.52.C6]|nr:hypothetical protein NVP1193O_157 [Vibrio phage 1.193.O._10N.286.52.C6]